MKCNVGKTEQVIRILIGAIIVLMNMRNLMSI